MNTPRVPADRKRHSLTTLVDMDTPSSKRGRASASATNSQSPVANGNVAESASSSSIVGTPTRQSSRLKTQSPMSEDTGRKRLKRT